MNKNKFIYLIFICVLILSCKIKEKEAIPKKQMNYVASVKRDPFHKPSCKWAKKISSLNLDEYETRQQAINAGHRPCKVCKP